MTQNEQAITFYETPKYQTNIGFISYIFLFWLVTIFYTFATRMQRYLFARYHFFVAPNFCRQIQR